MGATSGPFAIRRLALQVEMDDGTMMTFYADPAQAAGAMVTIEQERPEYYTRNAHPLVATQLPPEITFTVGPVSGYVMTLRNPADLMKPAAEIDGSRKEIEQ